jgi:hypothetical protein
MNWHVAEELDRDCNNGLNMMEVPLERKHEEPLDWDWDMGW